MLPPKTDKRWRDLVTGKINAQVDLLATRLMLANVTTSAKNDPSEANINKCVDAAYAYFQKYEKMAEKDLSAVFK